MWFLIAAGQEIEACESTNSPWLTLDRLFASREFEGDSPDALQWREQGGGYTTLESARNGGQGKDLVWHDPATARTEVLVPAHRWIPPGETAPLSLDHYAFSDDGSKLLIYTNSKKVWRQKTRGDYWVLDVASFELKKLGGEARSSTLMFGKFSPDGSRVAYLRENNLYVQNVGDGRIVQLTHDGSPTCINGTFDWVYEEELDLRDGFRWSPDSQFIAYWQLDTEGVRTFYLINNTDGLYSRPIPIPYPKAGETNPAARIGVVSAAGGDTRWMAVPGDSRDHYLAHMDWAGNSDTIVIQRFNRLQNSNCVMLANARLGTVQTILTETDRAWVENNNDLRWIRQGRQFLWLSERDGWQQVYRLSRNGKKTIRLTSGDFDVISLEACDETNRCLYFLASPDNPTQRYLYRVQLKGGSSERLTPADQPGTHHYQISPEAQWAVHTWSTFTRPPVVELVHLPDHRVVKTFTDNQKLEKSLAALQRPSSEFFRIDIGDGVQLDGWCLRPPDFDPEKKYPALFHVYGEPAGQTVLDRWGGRNQLWHWMLAQQGYVVLSVDNRGTPAPRGRDWRKCVYRQIGVLASADQAAAVRAILQRWPWIDPQRIGIWGWSGGGSMSLNAILRYPDLYQTAMAVAPVANERYYDSIYQERYMGLPADNAAGYREGSSITYAHQLKGNLLLVHGTGDDNCHYQGTEALINELIANKKQFTMMAYPNRSHSISEGENTTRHLFELLTRYLRQYLPPNPPEHGSTGETECDSSVTTD